MSDGFSFSEQCEQARADASRGREGGAAVSTIDDEHRQTMLRRAAQDGRTSINIGDSLDAYQDEALRFAFYPRTLRVATQYPRVIPAAIPLSNHTEEIPVYPALAMLGEIGELAEKVQAEDPRGVIAELGDVLWYVTAAARALGYSLYRVVGVPMWSDATFMNPPEDGEPRDLVLELLAVAGRFAEKRAKKPWRDGSPIDSGAARDDLSAILRVMMLIANQYGQTLGQVAQGNIDKLVARRRRGTLTGSGDAR